eukprot:GHVH01000532.1.p1 GENE.GHVH01000532.1~~GHVH01000532.1.p1  ORF type:complete len:354 (-),score=31.97 GHVH01000532.1:925-1986(-)
MFWLVFTTYSTATFCSDLLEKHDCMQHVECLWGGVSGWPNIASCRDVSEWKNCRFWQSREFCSSQREILNDVEGKPIIRENCVWAEYERDEGISVGECLEKVELCRTMDMFPDLCCYMNRWGLIQTEEVEINGDATKGSIVYISRERISAAIEKESLIISQLNHLSDMYDFDLATLIHFPYLSIQPPTNNTCVNQFGDECQSDCLMVSTANDDTIRLLNLDGGDFLGEMHVQTKVCLEDIDPKQPVDRYIVVDVDLNGVEDWGCQYMYSSQRCISATGGFCQGVFRPELRCEGRTEETHCEFPNQAGQICYWKNDSCVESSYSQEDYSSDSISGEMSRFGAFLKRRKTKYRSN